MPPAATSTPPRPQVATRQEPPHPAPATPTPPSAAPRPPSPTAAVPPAPNVDTTPRINLGGTDSLSNTLVQGDQVIPAGPDPKVHNREPIYPDAAVRRGQQGMVILVIHVTPDGLPSVVEVERSSGFQLLDRAAQEAVETWRFVPAVRDGQPIPSSMSLRINFQLD